MISTGIKYLDTITGGLHLGDNVVWQISDGVPVEFFIKSYFSRERKETSSIVYINFNYSPQTIKKKYSEIFNKENVTLLDAFTHGKGKSDSVFTDFYNNEKTSDVVCIEDPTNFANFIKILNIIESKNKEGSFYIFDSLTGMYELWKDESAVLDFFAFTCPKLYDLNTLAYWIYEKEAHSKEFIAGILHITQIVFSLKQSDSHFFALHIKKLENRPSFDPHPCLFSIVEKEIQFHDKKLPTIKIGEKVKEQRKILHMTQAELAHRLHLTPGAISQIENDNISPSIQTLIQLTSIFKKSFEYFLDDQVNNKNYMIFNNTIFNNRNYTLTKLIPDHQIASPYFLSINPKEKVDGPILLHKGEEILIVSNGEVNIIIDDNEHALSKGDSLILRSSFLQKIINTGDEISDLIYILL